MYLPKHFSVNDDDEVFEFIETYAFGQLISTHEGRPFASHIPFLLSDDRQKLIGHLAKQNPQYSNIADQQVLVTLTGAHGYISPSWYQSPGVPTWNYQAVHIYGHCKVITEAEEIRSIVETLTAKNEAVFSTPWIPDYPNSMLTAIVGIEITVSEIQAKFKLSQNRPAKDRVKVIDRLNTLGSTELANAIQQQR